MANHIKMAVVKKNKTKQEKQTKTEVSILYFSFPGDSLAWSLQSFLTQLPAGVCYHTQLPILSN